MITPTSRKPGPHKGASLAAVALAVACAFGSAASAQISTMMPAKQPALQVSIQPLVIFVDHQFIETNTSTHTIPEALAEANIHLGPNDVVLPRRNGALPADGILHVERVKTWTQNVCSRITPDTQTHYVATLPKNATRTEQTGTPGLLQTTLRYVSIDGKPTTTFVVASHLLVAAQPRIIARGTAMTREEMADRFSAPAEDTLSRTSTLAHSAISMIATAYTAFCDTCSGTGRGSTGMLVHHGVVAVDPRVIPLGSHLFIPGYGHAIAGDTGGAIVGQRIDLAFNSYGDAIRFGRRPVTVYVLR